MRLLPLLGLLVASFGVACSNTESVVDPGQAPLTDALIPSGAFACTFDVGHGPTRAFQQEVLGPDALRWSLAGAGVLTDVTREGDSFYFTDGPRRGTELIRLGARPGTRWESDGQRVHFHSWERIEVPAGFYDTARIEAVAGPANFADRVTWWFAPGVGLVQLEYDRGGVDIKRLSRATP